MLTRNVAGEAIDGALPTMPSVKQHFRALPHPDVADALETICRFQGQHGREGLSAFRRADRLFAVR